MSATDVSTSDPPESSIERVLRFDLNVPSECCFRKSGAINGWPTYSVPPLTTIRGMIYNALCRPSLLMQYSHHYRTMDKEEVDSEAAWRSAFEERTAIGIRVLDLGIEYTNFRMIHKRNEKSDTDRATYKRAPANVDSLVEPRFQVFIGDSGSDGLLGTIAEAIRDPARPLYLGRSDDLVIVESPEITPVERIDEAVTLDCVVPNSLSSSDGWSSTDGKIELLPTRAETIGGRSPNPASGKVVSVEGGDVDWFYESLDKDGFVFIDSLKRSG